MTAGLGATPVTGQETATAPTTAAAEQPSTAPAAPVQLAHIRLTGEVLDSPPGFVLFPQPKTRRTLRNWLHRLAEARQDRAVGAVALEVDFPRMSWAQAQELADAVDRLSDVKPVYCYLPSGGTAAYLVASAGSDVSLHPAGNLFISGLGTELFYYRGTLDLLGIEPQVVQMGRFKGAGEPFTRTGPSDEMKQVLNWVLDDLYEQLCEQIARQRDLKVDQVRNVIDQGPFTAPKAQLYRLVDQTIEHINWREHVDSVVAGDVGETQWLADYAAPSEPSVDFSNPFALLRTLLGGREKEKVREPTIAIIHADGMIVTGRNRDGLFGQPMVGSDTLVNCFDRARMDDRIKAVLFRVNSPGGSALASEFIYQAARRCAEEKPVIASISSMGASGGYYIALGADTIVADPSAIVGSIGVISGKLALTGLLDKLGISTYRFTRGRNAGMWSTRAWTPSEKDRIRQMTRRIYNVFTRRVVVSRDPIDLDNIDAVAQGRIFTARQSVEKGLIDSVGGFREAVIAAQQAAGIDQSYFVSWPQPRTLLDMMQAGDTTAPPVGGMPKGDVGALARLAGRSPGVAYLLNLATQLDQETVLTALPYYIRISP